MANKEIGGKSGFTPKGGAFSEAAAFVRELVRQGLMDRVDAIGLTEKAYRETMISQALGFPVGFPEELPEHSKRFPGATNADGTVNFSKS